LEVKEEIRRKYYIKCVTGPSKQRSVSLLARVYEIRIFHHLGSVAHAAKSSHSYVVFSGVHIVHHLGVKIRVVDYILLYVSEVGAASTDIIIK
jgi:hypothetical protein